MKKLTGKQLRARWVKALRSGEYGQTTGSLYRSANDAYCCLGVLCEVAGLNRLGNAKTLDRSTRFRPLRDALDLGSAKAGAQEKLIDLNDEEFWSFKRIATWIEKNVNP